MPERTDARDPVAEGGPLPGMLDLQLILDLMVSDGQVFPLTGERPHIKFGSDKRFGGFGGCNRYFGAYGVSGERIAISKIGATRMYCEGRMELEDRFLGTLQRVERHAIESIRLRLFSEDERNVLRFYVPV